MVEKQKTIINSVSVSGIGLHTGNKVTLRFLPAPENHGFQFKRVDVDGTPIIEADVDNVTHTTRGTTLEKNGVQIHTVEHVLAALTALDYDNVLIEMDSPEAPILDGSSKFYVEALSEAGIVEQEAERKYFEVTKPIVWADKEKKIELMLIPSDNYRISCMIDYELDVLGTQNACLNDLSEFKDNFSMCRTFVFLHELEYLFTKEHLIKGGTLNNAIVFVDQEIPQEKLDKLSTLFDQPKVEVRPQGILNNLELHYANEPARHKLLDVIGDLTLCGMRIKGHVIANRPGHQPNVEFARLIKKEIKKADPISGIPTYDPNKKPIYDINDIKKMLPHRNPFLLVDKIIEMGDSHVVGVKGVTMNEPFFVGHFPNEPVMPGVLQVEALAQNGGILILSQLPDPENYITYFLKIENVKFRQKVVPGDTLIFKNVLLAPIRRGLCHMKGYAYIGDKLVMEGELMAQIVKKQ